MYIASVVEEYAAFVGRYHLYMCTWPISNSNTFMSRPVFSMINSIIARNQIIRKTKIMPCYLYGKLSHWLAYLHFKFEMLYLDVHSFVLYAFDVHTYI